LNSNDNLIKTMEDNLKAGKENNGGRLKENFELMKKFSDACNDSVAKLDEITHVVMPSFPLTVDLTLYEEFIKKEDK